MYKKIITGILLFLLILVGITFGTYKYYSSKFFSPPKVANNKNNDSSTKETPPVKPYFTKPVNILVLGVDERTNDRGRSDTIMIYHIDPATNKVNLLSVPRDTYVNIPGRGMDKVNHAYAFGGLGLSQKTLEEFLGIKIDYYIKTNFSGFVSLIDQIGGVSVYVEKDINGTDIKSGVQKLDGKNALAYVRDRKDPMGDIARVGRQQRFMKAIAIGVAQYQPKWKLILRIPQIYNSVNTDLAIDGANGLYQMLQKLDLDSAQIEQVPGWFYDYNGISYWKPDQVKTAATVQKLFSNDSN